MRRQTQCLCVCWWISLVAGGVLFTSGVMLLLHGTSILRGILAQQQVLRNNTSMYELWLDPPVDVMLQFYFYNITNPQAMMQGARGHVTQRGPYTYRQRTQRSNISFLSSGDLLAYTSNMSFSFVPEMSVGPETDTFHSLNLPLLGVAAMTEHTLTPGMKSFLSSGLWLAGESMFRTYTVGEYLWGYRDSLLGTLKSLMQTMSMDEAETIPDVVGIFTGPNANGSKSGDWVVYTGRSDEYSFNAVYSWNNKRSLTCWGSPEANMINGSDGAMWHAMIEQHEDIYMFIPIICRSLKFTYNSTVRSKDLDLSRFVLAGDTLASAQEYPPNKAYCTPSCLPRGLLNLTVCNDGPVFLSKPHFLGADPALSENMTGLKPLPEHETHNDIHAASGAGVFVQTKLQFNIQVKPYTVLYESEKMRPAYFPVMWFNASGEVSDPTILSLCQHVDQLVELLAYTRMLSLALGSILVLGAAACCLGSCTRRRNTNSKLEADDDKPFLSSSRQATNDGVPLSSPLLDKDSASPVPAVNGQTTHTTREL